MRHKIVTIIFASALLLPIFSFLIPFGHSVEWSPDMRLTWESGFDVFPSITQTDDGLIWVVWCSDRTGNTELFYKVYNGTMVHPWSPETRLTEDLNEDLTPSIMQAQDGTIWVVWVSKRAGNTDIYYKTYNGSWSPDTPLTTDPNKDNSPSIIQTTDGTIWVFWDSDRSDQSEIHYATSSDNGEIWTQEPLTQYSGLYNKDPAAMQAANDTIWVVWERNEDIYYSLYNGTSWSPMEPLITDPHRDLQPSIMQAQDGAIWLAWTHYREVAPDEYDLDIYYSTYDGSWSGNTRLTTDPGPDKGPSILQAQDGTIWITWTSNRLQATDLYYITDSVPPENDVSIFSVEPSETFAVQGKNASIEVVAQNKGTNTQTFDVKCYADSTLIGTKTVFSLVAGQLNVTRFQWNTSSVSLGTYALRAEAILPGDAWAPDNTYYGTITVVKHDVAIKSVTPSETIAQQGYKLHIDVVVRNEGNFTENVTVTVYRDSTGIGPSKTRNGLAPNAEATMTFEWTPIVPYGDYLIKARAAQVTDEFILSNNLLEDGNVTVTIPGDVNGDHNVNISDLLLISNHWNSESYDANVDIQNDGSIDISDIFIASVHWNESW